jgi:hypothetical protein
MNCPDCKSKLKNKFKWVYSSEMEVLCQKCLQFFTPGKLNLPSQQKQFLHLNNPPEGVNVNKDAESINISVSMGILKNRNIFFIIKMFCATFMMGLGYLLLPPIDLLDNPIMITFASFWSIFILGGFFYFISTGIKFFGGYRISVNVLRQFLWFMKKCMNPTFPVKHLSKPILKISSLIFLLLTTMRMLIMTAIGKLMTLNSIWIYWCPAA